MTSLRTNRPPFDESASLRSVMTDGPRAPRPHIRPMVPRSERRSAVESVPTRIGPESEIVSGLGDR